MSEADEAVGRGQRLDKWLWHARFTRTRSAAARLIEEGFVRVNGQRIETVARRVRPGEVLTVALGRAVRIVRVCAIAARRGGAEEAQSLYEAVEASKPVGSS